MKNIVANLVLLFFISYLGLTTSVHAASSSSISRIATIPSGVHGMVVADDGTLYFSDSYGTKRVYSLLPPYTGAPQVTSISGATPAGLLWDNGTLYVADVQASTVRQYSANFSLLKTWNAASPWSLVKGNNGEILTTSFNGLVQRLNNDGTATTLITGLSGPFGIAKRSDNTYWVSEQGGAAGAPGYLRRWNLTQGIQETYNYDWANPEGLAIDSEDSLWIAETEKGQILRLLPNGQLSIEQANLSFPIIITETPDGKLLFNTSGSQPGLYQITLEQGGETPAPMSLEKGVAVTNLSVAQANDELNFMFNVPESVTNLTFQMSGGVGDADLLVRRGAAPTDSEYDCRPYLSGNNEVCTFDESATATYYITLKAYAAFSGVSLLADYAQTSPPVANGYTLNDLSANRSSWSRYTINVPAGSTSLDIDISGGSGDADLYVKYAAQSSTRSYDCRPYKDGNDESCSFTNPSAGVWYIDIRAYRAFSGLTLNAYVTP